MSKKIRKIEKTNKLVESDKEHIISKVQNENTTLIKECNTLREERKKNRE